MIMLNSMTGYGRAELTRDSKRISVEIKSVNHRYLDLNIRMPRKFNCFDAQVRAELRKYMIRGKVDVFISYDDTSESASSLRYNKELAAAYLEFFKQMKEDFSVLDDTQVSAASLARFPEVLTMEEQSLEDESVVNLIKEAVNEAGESFARSRAVEGKNLADDLMTKLSQMESDTEVIEKRYPQILSEYEAKLRTKLDELISSQALDESRIAAELVIFADKLCTDEETVRLKNHIKTMKEVIIKGGEAGRRLDFMAQEMNREANTILSKANDLRTSGAGISLKTTIEKIREQIQNIE